MQRVFSLFATAALVFVASQSPAQTVEGRASADGTKYETVMVYAPYVVKRQIVSPMASKTSSTGLELVSISQAVSFADLDLSDVAQVKQLESRVRQAALHACGEIERKFPRSRYIPVPENQDCIGNATSAAMIAVKALEVAAARY